MENQNFFGKDYINYSLKFQKSSVREPHFYDPQFKINSKVMNLNNHTHALNHTNYPNNFHNNYETIAIHNDSKQENNFNNHPHSRKNKGRKNDSNNTENDINEDQTHTKTSDLTNSTENHVDDKNPYLKYVEKEMDHSYQPAESEYFIHLASWHDGRASIVNLARSLARTVTASIKRSDSNESRTFDFPFKPSTIQQYLYSTFFCPFIILSRSTLSFAISLHFST
jgi:hypothetical protein